MSFIENLGGSGMLCGIAVVLWLTVTLTGLIKRQHSGMFFSVPTIIGCVFILLAATAGKNCTPTFPYFLSLGDAGFSFVIDPLSRWFLAIIGIIGIPVALFTPGYLHHLRHRISLGFVWAALALLMTSMVGVVLSANAIMFLVAWEVMALSSFILVIADHEKRDIKRAAFIYLGATRTGTAFLMAGFIWAHYLTGSWTFSEWQISGSTALIPALLIFVGLATKAGSWPFHLWLPIAHPAAPAPVSAIMSGVMIKTAIYAMARLFVVGDHFDVPALGPILLILGAISAFWGVIFALLQHDLKRLLAYHSVENIGIIMMGLGISLLGRSHGIPLLTELGLAAALFHTLNHAIFKSLLFLGAGAVDARTHLRDVEKLGGLIHRMPWTAGAFVVGSAAICALPPLNGFASEWILYQGFFSLAQDGPSVGMRLGALLLMGWLALIGALAIACFVKAVGVVFLGNPRSQEAEKAREATRGMVAAQVILALLCIGLGIAAPLVLKPLGRIAAQTGGSSSLNEAWTIPIALIAVLLIGTVGVLGLWLQGLSRSMPVRRFITWECGFGDLGPRTQYTASSFAQPISRLFGAIYSYAVEVTIKGRNRHHFPDAVAVETVHEAHLETKVYAPLLKNIQRMAGIFLMRLQAGSIHQYLLYMAVVLGLLLWVGVRG
ncbi:MAG: proton-conducting transporter transmembrane domain-containing protein [Armatimonadota bacterium]